MVNKALIAHELGHAIAALVQDSGFIPVCIELFGSKGTRAVCYMDDFKLRKHGLFGRIPSICDLGGIYGELLYHGYWNPWGARQDLDSFIIENPRLEDLTEWYWISTEENSFRYYVAHPTVKVRRSIKVDSHDTARYTPFIWDAYCDFCDRIDKEEFRTIVNELHKEKAQTIEGEELAELGKRILL